MDSSFRPYLDNLYSEDKGKILQIDRDVGKFLNTRIKILFGTELKKNIDIKEGTLIILEESHTAQSKGQLPDIFLQSKGLTFNGNNQHLEYNKVFMLSVSATPYSELINIYTREQNKFIVMLESGDGYRGFQYQLDNNCLIPFNSVTDKLIKTMIDDVGKKKGFIIARSTSKIEENIKRCVENYRPDIDFITFDQNSKKLEDSDELSINMHLNIKPDRLTIIFIKGKCRMGQNLNKTHILAVMETSATTKTDTLAQ